MSDRWAELAYVGLILIGILVVANAVLWLAHAVMRGIAGLLAVLVARARAHDEQTATLGRIAETLERIEADRAAGR